jgi:hypothetical protein
MTSLRLGYGPLLLLLYQAAPLSVQQDSLGRYRVSAGFAGGQWENEEFSCDGQLLSATPVRHHSAGLQVDYWPEDRVRLSAFGGVTSQSIGQTQGTDSSYFPYIEGFSGPYGGAQLAYEGQKIGLGVGITHVRSSEGWTSFAPYFRLGDIDGSHFRADFMTPSPALPSNAWARMGVGFNEGHRRGVGGFLGVGFGPLDYNEKAVFIGEVRFPVARRLGVQLQGLTGPGERTPQWGAGFGLRYDFGSRQHIGGQ